MLCVWVHGCDPGRVSGGSRLALLYETLSIECPSIFFWHVLCGRGRINAFFPLDLKRTIVEGTTYNHGRPNSFLNEILATCQILKSNFPRFKRLSAMLKIML